MREGHKTGNFQSAARDDAKALFNTEGRLSVKERAQMMKKNGTIPMPKLDGGNGFFIDKKARKFEVGTVTLDDGTTIETRADGTQLQTNPNGRTIEVLKDGSRLQKDPDGKQVLKKRDGTFKQTNPDGSTIERMRDGGLVQKTGNGSVVRREPPPDRIQFTQRGGDLEDGVVVQTLRDGTKIHKFPDGSQIKILTTGVKIQLNPEGKEMVRSDGDGDGRQDVLRPGGVSGKGVIRLKNGVTVQTTDEGVVIQTEVDGTIMETYPDGFVIQRNPPPPRGQGEIITIRTDGSMFQQNANGKTVETLANKNEIESWPDGIVRTTFKGEPGEGGDLSELLHCRQTFPPEDGALLGITIDIRRDGTRLQTMPDGATLEILEDGSQIQTNADGTKIEVPIESEQTFESYGEGDVPNDMLAAPDFTPKDPTEVQARLAKMGVGMDPLGRSKPMALPFLAELGSKGGGGGGRLPPPPHQARTSMTAGLKKTGMNVRARNSAPPVSKPPPKPANPMMAELQGRLEKQKQKEAAEFTGPDRPARAGHKAAHPNPNHIEWEPPFQHIKQESTVGVSDKTSGELRKMLVEMGGTPTSWDTKQLRAQIAEQQMKS